MQKLLFFIILFSAVQLSAQTERLVQIPETHLFNARYSPDGRYIAFTKDNYRGLYVLETSTGRITELTDHASAGFGFSWSADSRMILTKCSRFTETTREDAVIVFYPESGTSLQLTDFSYGPHIIPSWASENSIVTGTAKEISTINLNREKTAEITHPYAYFDKIAVPSAGKVNSLLTNSLTAEKSILNFSLSSDKSKAVFELLGGGIYVWDIKKNTFNYIDLGNRPAFSQDGSRIAYMKTTDDGHMMLTSEIWVSDVTGAVKIMVTDTPSRIETDPSFAPDGLSIIYSELNSGAIYSTVTEGGLR